MHNVDVKENELLSRNEHVLKILLYDHTTRENIFWATDSYASLGEGYGFHDAITISKITGDHGNVIRPRAVKSKDEQSQRVKDMAEVFTPSWVCNAQNNLVDEAWFGRKDVFNHEQVLPSTDVHTWAPVEDKIAFPEGKTWKQYVAENVLEMTCGEAPYLVSRYDTVTGEPIPINCRIGLLDRKLRVLGENTATSAEWLRGAQSAFKATFGFEWQGDNLLLAREALFLTFIEYYEAKFGHLPQPRSMEYIAYIISWNLFQMDGLKGVVPESCTDNVKVTVVDLFGSHEEIERCEGCHSGDIKRHNGIYCTIRDWGHTDPKTHEPNRIVRFIDLMQQ